MFPISGSSRSHKSQVINRNQGQYWQKYPDRRRLGRNCFNKYIDTIDLGFQSFPINKKNNRQIVNLWLMQSLGSSRCYFSSCFSPALSVRIYCLGWSLVSLVSWQMFAHCMKYWRAKTDSSNLGEGQHGDLSILGIFCLSASDGLIQTEIQFSEIFSL